MASNLYTVDVIRHDGTTHHIFTAMLSDTEAALVKAWLASVSSSHVGATSGTLTQAATNPVNYATLLKVLQQQFPMSAQPNLHPALPAEHL